MSGWQASWRVTQASAPLIPRRYGAKRRNWQASRALTTRNRSTFPLNSVGPSPLRLGSLSRSTRPQKRPGAARRALAGRLHSRKVLAGGGLVAACLVVALALWLWPGEVATPAPASAPGVAVAPVPATAVPPMAPLESVPAMSTPAPARAVESGPAATAGTQKEGSTVTTQKPETPKPARTPRAEKQPTSAAVCRTLAFAAAVAAGCTGVPKGPEPFECPERVEKAMREQGWGAGYRFSRRNLMTALNATRALCSGPVH